MSRARALVDALARVAARFSADDRAEKLRLLGALGAAPIGEAGALLRLHEALCFLQAYPDDPEVLAAVEGALAGFPARTTRLGRAALARLHGSGVAGSSLDYPFGLPMTRWLVARFPRDAEVAWGEDDAAERLEEVLPLLVTRAEDDAFSEGGLPCRQWLRLAKGGRRMTDLQVLVELFELAPLDEPVREELFEGPGLSIRWRLRSPAGSRTLAKQPWPRPFFHPAGPRRLDRPLAAMVEQRLPAIRRAPPRLAEELIEAARRAMATRGRELYAFSHPNAEDVWVADPGEGLRVTLIGLQPDRRLPFEGYYAFFVLKNGVPVSYGGGWSLFDTMEFGFNIFPTFRQGESAFILSQVLRVYRQHLGPRTVIVDPYQLGRDNPEALRSGAFYFYHRLGFRPRDPAVLRVLGEEERQIARDRAYRSPLKALAQLARAEVCLTLPGGHREPEHRVRAAQLAALVTRRVAREFGGDRGAAVRAAAGEVGRALGAGRWRGWPRAEREAFERWALLLGQIPDLRAWPVADKRRLVNLVRAKEARSEARYHRLLGSSRRLHRALAALARGPGAEPPSRA